MNLTETKREIRRLTGDEVNKVFEDDYCYEVLDDESVEGTYYLIVKKDMSAVTLTSITDEGMVNQGDLVMLATKVTCCQPIVAENGYIFVGDVAQILDELLDQHAIIIQNDIDNDPLTDNPDALPIAIPDLLSAGDEEEPEPDADGSDGETPVQMPGPEAAGNDGQGNPAPRESAYAKLRDRLIEGR